MVVYSNGFKWNSENEQILRERWVAGVKAALIAAELKTGKNSVIGKARRLGLPIHPSKPSKSHKVAVARRVPPINPSALKIQEKRIMLPVQEPSSNPGDWIPFENLTADTCRAILGNSKENGLALFCPNKAAGTYCPYHNERFYDRTWRPRNRGRDALQRLAALQK